MQSFNARATSLARSVFVGAVVFCSGTAIFAQSPPNIPSNGIITVSGVYKMTANLTKGIQINVGDVTLNMNGKSLTGNNSGIGINIAAGLGNVIINGTGTVTKFSTGIYVNPGARQISVNSASTYTKTVTLSYNLGNGMQLDQAMGVTVYGINAHHNGGNGYRTDGGFGHGLYNSSLTYNTICGVNMDAANDCAIGTVVANNNGYGIKFSNGNAIDVKTSEANNNTDGLVLVNQHNDHPYWQFAGTSTNKNKFQYNTRWGVWAGETYGSSFYYCSMRNNGSGVDVYDPKFLSSNTINPSYNTYHTNCTIGTHQP
jgi:hypothetical protein